MADVRFEPKLSGIAELLVRAETERMIREKTERVAAAARAANPTSDKGEPIPVVADVRVGKHRVHGMVALDHPAGLAVETEDSILLRAISAAR